MDWQSFLDLLPLLSIAAALGGILYQNYANLKLERARFVIEYNEYMKSYAHIRHHLRSGIQLKDLKSTDGETYEEFLDYLTSFEILDAFERQGVISITQVEEYFGGRFSELMDSAAVKDTINDPEFESMYRLLNNLQSKLDTYTKLNLKIKANLTNS